MAEAAALLASEGLVIDLLRVRAFPFHEDVERFISAHDQVFLVEQNRDGQLRTLIVNECAVDPAKLIAVLHYDGTPITANFIQGAIAARLRAPFQQRLKEAVA
jgi:2-oxoglutarate ferredoxin oxidoreductase subunit alpha